MVKAEPAYNKSGEDVWFGMYCTGKFWHTVRDDSGRAIQFEDELAAAEAARREWHWNVRTKTA